MVNDAPMANPEDRIQDLIMNIEEMKTVLSDIWTSWIKPEMRFCKMRHRAFT